MANLLNLAEILTLDVPANVLRLLPFQVLQRGGALPQPFGGVVRDRPFFGQMWPRGEWQSDVAVGANLPLPPPLAATVTVTPAEGSIDLAGGTPTLQLTAVVQDANGNVMAVTPQWVSLDPSKATVDANGLVTGVAVGNVTISAVAQGKVGQALVHVFSTPPAVATVTVTPASWSLGVGQTFQLTATVKDGSGNILSGRIVTWDTNNHAIATVNSTGLVTGVAAGSVVVTATCETHPGTSSGTIVPGPLVLTPIIYLSLDETAGTQVVSSGSNKIALTATNESIVTGEVGKARQTTTEVGQLGTGFAITSDHSGPTFLQMPGNHAWSVALFIDRGLGVWFDAVHVGASAFASMIGDDDQPNHPRMVPMAWSRVGVVGADSQLVTQWQPNVSGLVTQVWLNASQLSAGRHHLAITNDPDAGVLRFFRDGVLITETLAANAIGWADGVVRWCSQIGAGWGWIDEVYVFDRALTATEVHTLASV